MAKDETEQALPSVEECVEAIRTKPCVPIWPTVGVALGLKKAGSYNAARRGDFELLEIGRLKKVITAPLRKKLGI